MPYINSIIKDLKMYRTRVMILNQRLVIHIIRILQKEYIYPLFTNDKCFFIINSQVKQYPADGNYYVVDTTQMHTAINASKKDRIHIIGVINGPYNAKLIQSRPNNIVEFYHT